MGYRNLQETVVDLERHRQLIRIDSEVDPYLEAGAIQRRVYAAGVITSYSIHYTKLYDKNDLKKRCGASNTCYDYI